MKKVLYFCLFLFTLSLYAQNQDSDQVDIKILLESATQSYQEALEISAKEPWKAEDLFKRSIQFYQGIIDAGVSNGALYYNMGNAYFRINNLGKAILYYKKALEYIPGDGNLIQNLNFARSKRIDDIQDKEGVKILKTLLFFHFDISSDIKTILFILSFISLWIFAGLLLFINRKIFRNLLIIFTTLACFFFVSMVLDQWSRSNQSQGVVLADEIVARKGDSVSFDPSFQDPLHNGTEFTIVEQRGDWYQVELNDGRRTWLPRKSIGLVADI